MELKAYQRHTKGIPKAYQRRIKGMAEAWMAKGGGKVVGINPTIYGGANDIRVQTIGGVLRIVE